MTSNQIARLAALHERAERHKNAFKRLAGDRSTQWKALQHLRKAERLYSQVSTVLRGLTPDTA